MDIQTVEFLRKALRQIEATNPTLAANIGAAVDVLVGVRGTSVNHEQFLVESVSDDATKWVQVWSPEDALQWDVSAVVAVRNYLNAWLAIHAEPPSKAPGPALVPMPGLPEDF